MRWRSLRGRPDDPSEGAQSKVSHQVARGATTCTVEEKCRVACGQTWVRNRREHAPVLVAALWRRAKAQAHQAIGPASHTSAATAFRSNRDVAMAAGVPIASHTARATPTEGSTSASILGSLADHLPRFASAAWYF